MSLDNKDILDDEKDQITLTLEDDSELVCDVIAIFPCKDKTYIALTPEGNEDIEEDIYLYGFVEHEDESIELVDIETDEEFDEVSEAYYSFLDDNEYDIMFSDEDEDEN